MTDLTHRTHSSCRSTSVMLENPFLLWTCTASIRADSPLAARNSSIQCWSTLLSLASNPLKLRPRRNREMQSSGPAPDRVASDTFSLLPSTAFRAELQEAPDNFLRTDIIDPDVNKWYWCSVCSLPRTLAVGVSARAGQQSLIIISIMAQN